MKLVDLFEAPEYEWNEKLDMPRRADKRLQATVKSRMADPEVEYVGSGASAFVSRSKSPHHMDDVERVSLDEDPTAAYLTLIHNTPELHDNPYFPRVRQVQQQGTVVSIVAERLHNYTSEKLFTSRMIQATWERMTDAPLVEDPEAQMGAIEELIERALLGRRAIPIKDQNLVQAIEVIRQLAQKTGAIVDIHDGNLMWRITGTMPQLVITDPIT